MSEPGRPARRNSALVAREVRFRIRARRTSGSLRGRGPEEVVKMHGNGTGRVTVRVPYPPPMQDGNGAGVAHCVARQALAADLARKQGLDVVV